MTLTLVPNNHSHEYDCRNDPVFYYKALVIGYLGLCDNKGLLSWVSLWVDIWYRWMSCRKTHLQVSSLEIPSRMAKQDGTSSSQTSFAVRGPSLSMASVWITLHRYVSLLLCFWHDLRNCYCVVLWSYTIIHWEPEDKKIRMKHPDPLGVELRTNFKHRAAQQTSRWLPSS